MSNQEDIPTDRLVAIYVKIRTAIQAKEEQHKAELAELKEQFDVVSQKLLEVCNDQNAESIRTPFGTISRRVSSRYWTTDWESMYNFIKEHDAPYLLEQRIHNGNMKQFLEENPDALPAGLQADRKYVVQVRKPTAK
jgi:urate oxidase